MRLLLLLISTVLCAQFEGNSARPLDARQEPLSERPTARMWGGSFLAVDEGRINYVLVEPKLHGRAAKARHPGVLFQHGGGQSMSNYISEALLLAELGATSLLVDVPGAPDMTPAKTVVNLRRALQLLLSQAGMDGKRIAYVGHSYGGTAGGTLAGVETRIAVYVLIGAVPSMARHIRESKHAAWTPWKARPEFEQEMTDMQALDADRFLPRARAPILVQCARFDTPDNLKACPAVHRLAGGPKTLTWYEDDHNFTSLEAMRDRLYWLESKLHLRGAAAALERWVRRP